MSQTPHGINFEAHWLVVMARNGMVYWKDTDWLEISNGTGAGPSVWRPRLGAFIGKSKSL